VTYIELEKPWTVHLFYYFLEFTFSVELFTSNSYYNLIYHSKLLFFNCPFMFCRKRNGDESVFGHRTRPSPPRGDSLFLSLVLQPWWISVQMYRPLWNLDPTGSLSSAVYAAKSRSAVLQQLHRRRYRQPEPSTELPPSV